MKGRAWAALAVLATLAAASPASSQIEPLLGDSPVVMPGVELTALGGPPWWTVSKGNSTVYVLASAGAPVDGWDTVRLQEILTGANRLILPPDIKAGLAVVMPQLRDVARRMQGGSTQLEYALLQKPTAPGNIRTFASFGDISAVPLKDFRQARLKAGLPESRYGGLPLSLASFALAGDVYDRLAQPSGEPVEQTAQRLAQARSVPSGPAISYGGKDWTRLLDQIGAVDLTCVKAVLTDVEQALARAPADQAATQAWANGDVAPVLRDGARRAVGLTLRGADKESAVVLSVRPPYCLRQIPQFKQASDRWLADETEAVVSALKTPGKTVVVYPATDLFYVGGVFDQLIRRGFTVEGPLL